MCGSWSNPGSKAKSRSERSEEWPLGRGSELWDPYRSLNLNSNFYSAKIRCPALMRHQAKYWIFCFKLCYITLFTKYQINFTASKQQSQINEWQRKICVLHFFRISYMLCITQIFPASSTQCLFIYICSTGNLFNRFLMQLEFSISTINWAHTMIEANRRWQQGAGGEYFQGMSGLIESARYSNMPLLCSIHASPFKPGIKMTKKLDFVYQV